MVLDQVLEKLAKLGCSPSQQWQGDTRRQAAQHRKRGMTNYSRGAEMGEAGSILRPKCLWQEEAQVLCCRNAGGR